MSEHFVKLFGDSLRLIEREITPHAVGDFAVQCRRLLEKTGTKATYSSANLFGNWIVHSQLNRSAGIVEEINDFLSDLLTGVGGGPFGAAISAKFRLAELRGDYLSVCEKHDICPGVLTNDEKWIRIRDIILDRICETPLVADDKEIRRLAQLRSNCPYVVTSVLVTGNPETLKMFPGDKQTKFAFSICLAEKANLSAAPRTLHSQIVL